MTNLWPLGLLLCSCLMTTMAGHTKQMERPRYLVLFSKVCAPDSIMRVGLYFTGIKSNVSLRLDLYNCIGKTLQDGQSYSISPSDGFKVVNFSISSTLRNPHCSLYIRGKACGGVKFDYFERLVWKNRRVTVFIQLDRNMYKPGMKVKFRAFAMYANGIVADEKLVVVVKDPLRRIMGSWSRKQGSGKLGVFEGEMMTPTDVMPGVYSIRAFVKGAAKTKYFTMKQYDEPDFELKLTVPQADYYAPSIKAKVFANYKVGTPVCGKGTLIVQIPRYYYYWWWYSRYHIQEVKREFELNRYGKAVVKFSSTEIINIICRYYYPWYWYWSRYRYRCYYATYYLRYRSIRFIATVIDNASHQVVKKAKDVYITAHKTRLIFTGDTGWKFKPGLPMYIYVQDIRTNGKPNQNPVQSFLNYTVTYTNSTNCNGRWYWWWWWWYWRRPTWHTHLDTTVDLDAEKIATLKTTIPADACFVKVKVTNGKFTEYRTMSRYYSINGTYLHIQPEKTLNVDTKMKVTVMSNKKFGNFTCKGYSKGSLMLFKTVAVKELATEHKFRFEVKEDMAPVFHLLCYFIHPSNELIADGISSLVKFNPNKMRLHIGGDTEVKKDPGEKIKVRFSAEEKNTYMFVLGKEQRTLTKRNDIKLEDVTIAQMAHDLSNYNYKYRYDYNVFHLLRNTGLGVMANMNIPGRYYYHYNFRPYPFRFSRYYYYPHWYWVYYRIGPFASPPGRAFLPVKKYPKEEDKIISPPTILWDSNQTDNVFDTKVPETLTSLNFTGFGVHPTKGMAVVQIPLMVTVERRVFVSLYLPKWAVLGEIICMNSIAHNTGEENSTLSLKLKKSADFENVKINTDGGKQTEEFTRENLERKLGVIEAGTKKMEVFCIKPMKIGEIDVEVGVTGGGKYGLQKTIKIKPEGLKQCKTYPFLVEISQSNGFSATETVTLPSHVVNDSYSVSAIVTGDPLMAMAHKLSDLTRMPTCCGWENVRHLSLLSRIIANLLKNNRMSAELLVKARDALQADYMRELGCQRYDGSFSSNGNWDYQGSTWLTALVVQSLAKAWELKSYITPEPDVICRCIDFITSLQDVNGIFMEKGRVLHSDIQGGSAANNISRTAFIALVLHDTQKFLSEMKLKIAKSRVETALNLAMSYLEDNVNTDDTYSLAIMAYALKMLNSSKAAEALEKMNKTSTVDGDKMYLNGGDEAQSIEMTAYGLMALMANNAEDDAMKAYRWLNSKRKASGGFGSVQTDIVAVQALCAMTELGPKNFRTIKVIVSTVYKEKSNKVKDKSFEADVTPDNADELQTSDMKWRNKLKPLKIKVDGTVASTSEKLYAYAEVKVCYHVKSITKSGKLNTTVQVFEDEVRSFKLRTCVQRMSPPSQQGNNLVKAMISLPTAYALDKAASMYGRSVAKVRLDEGRLIMYYSQLHRKVCSTLKFKMVKGNVAHVQPARVLVTNIFNANEECLTEYSVENRNSCTVSNPPGCNGD